MKEYYVDFDKRKKSVPGKMKLSWHNPLLALEWENVRSLKVGLITVEIIDKENKVYQVDLSKLDYEIVVELKKRLFEKVEKLKPLAA
jgi:hypothetical protein